MEIVFGWNITVINKIMAGEDKRKQGRFDTPLKHKLTHVICAVSVY